MDLFSTKFGASCVSKVYTQGNRNVFVEWLLGLNRIYQIVNGSRGTFNILPELIISKLMVLPTEKHILKIFEKYSQLEIRPTVWLTLARMRGFLPWPLDSIFSAGKVFFWWCPPKHQPAFLNIPRQEWIIDPFEEIGNFALKDFHSHS